MGAARPTGICAIVHNLVGDASRTARTIAADRAAKCRAEPDRRGRVGVAHATRKCALVRNTSQASRLQQQLDAVSQLPKAKQRFVVEMLDTVLQGR